MPNEIDLIKNEENFLQISLACFNFALHESTIPSYVEERIGN